MIIVTNEISWILSLALHKNKKPENNCKPNRSLLLNKASHSDKTKQNKTPSTMIFSKCTQVFNVFLFQLLTLGHWGTWKLIRKWSWVGFVHFLFKTKFSAQNFINVTFLKQPAGPQRSYEPPFLIFGKEKRTEGKTWREHSQVLRLPRFYKLSKITCFAHLSHFAWTGIAVWDGDPGNRHFPLFFFPLRPWNQASTTMVIHIVEAHYSQEKW